MGQIWHAMGHRCCQRVHHLIFDIIGQIARRHGAIKMTPFVIDAFILGDGVEDQRHQAAVFRQDFRSRPPGFFANHRVRVAHHIQDFRFADHGVINGKFQTGGGFVKKPYPCRPPRRLTFQQKRFHIF